MKKVRCARCSVVNLEGFVSYPYCVTCGALLEVGAEEKVPLWRRPMRTVVWASLLALAIVTLVVAAANSLRHDMESEANIVVLTPRRAQVRAGEPFNIVLHIDAMNTDGKLSEEPLRGVRLRIIAKTLRRFQLIEVKPPPDQQYEVGAVRYYAYRKIERGSQLTLVMRALRLGNQPFNARLFSDNQTSDAIDVNVRVLPAPALQKR